MSTKVTLHDLAKETGFSVSTISRVLSGSDKYADDTRNAVLEAAKKLQYKTRRLNPNDFPKSHYNIALITDFHEGEFYSSFFYGYSQAAPLNNVRISLISLNEPREMIKEYIGLFSDQYYDGAILFIPALTRKDYEAITKDIPADFPMISNALIENPLLHTITFDGYSAGHMAAEHFRQKGHSKVGIIKGPISKAESRFRYNGFADYVHQHPAMQNVYEFHGDFNYQSGVQAFEAYQESPVKPTAIFVSNDLMCHGFIETAKDAGLNIPDDVALLGYDDLPMCLHTRPLLCSIKTDFAALAHASLETLLRLKNSTSQQIGLLSLIPVTLVERHSC
jgi:DNA-binding LacI/PurR family transcriptional regulator